MDASTAPVPIALACEWAIAAAMLRAVFARAADPVEVTELRLSVTASAYPGLAVIEYEFVNPAGMAVAAGTL